MACGYTWLMALNACIQHIVVGIGDDLTMALKDLITPNISACRKISVLLIKVLFVSRKQSNYFKSYGLFCECIDC
jgi:hypothetical protein